MPFVLRDFYSWGTRECSGIPGIFCTGRQEVQATLSNVHRHAQSPSVDIRFEITAGEAKLEVRDFGKGIDPELLRRFEASGAGVGIGLAGMRERLRELGGRLAVESDATGTLIRAVIPISASVQVRKLGK
jgi:signal transduction histidine kinase